MNRFGFAAVLAIVGLAGLGSDARAASLSISTDQPTYTIGQTVTVTVIGDSQGASDNAIAGTLQYSNTLTDTVGSSQSLLISSGLPWIPGILSTSDGSAEVFDQSRGAILPPATVSNQLTSTATLTAMGLGTVTLSWAPGLDFFGLSSGPSASFTIVPEPGTALLVGLGLAGIALAGRRR
jgi:inner membrane protein involved in colicin E2 resistance